jgi:hypothetical protein
MKIMDIRDILKVSPISKWPELQSIAAKKQAYRHQLKYLRASPYNARNPVLIYSE